MTKPSSPCASQVKPRSPLPRKKCCTCPFCMPPSPAGRRPVAPEHARLGGEAAVVHRQRLPATAVDRVAGNGGVHRAAEFQHQIEPFELRRPRGRRSPARHGPVLACRAGSGRLSTSPPARSRRPPRPCPSSRSAAGASALAATVTRRRSRLRCARAPRAAGRGRYAAQGRPALPSRVPPGQRNIVGLPARISSCAGRPVSSSVMMCIGRRDHAFVSVMSARTCAPASNSIAGGKAKHRCTVRIVFM